MRTQASAQARDAETLVILLKEKEAEQVRFTDLALEQAQAHVAEELEEVWCCPSVLLLGYA